MSDVVVTVPKGLWTDWLAEGDLPGEPESGDEYHFWVPRSAQPWIVPGDRVYIVAHDRLRGYAPLVRVEGSCVLQPSRACLVRRGGAQAVTITEPIRGFQGWRYRWWDRMEEEPLTDWEQPRPTVPDKRQTALL